MKQTHSIAELKALARECMLGKYGTAIALTLLIQAISAGISLILEFAIDSYTVYGLIILNIINLIITFVMYIFSVGMCRFFLNAAKEQPIQVSDLFYGFSHHPDKAILIGLFLFLCAIVCCIPFIGFMVAYVMTKSMAFMVASTLSFLLALAAVFYISFTYNLSLYLLADGLHECSVRQLLEKSRELMTGNRFRYFYMMVSFLGWFLLGMISCGIAYLWILPYMNCTAALFYLDLTGTLPSDTEVLQPEQNVTNDAFTSE